MSDSPMVVQLVSSDGKQEVGVKVDGISEAEYRQVSDMLVAGLLDPKRAYVYVAEAMLEAIRLCPEANPADLWVHLIYHQFINRARKSSQSWKRVGGDAFEAIVQRLYTQHLAPYGLHIRKSKSADAIHFGLREAGFGSAKTDLVLEGDHSGERHRFGVLHLKASIAERLTDDAPASVALIQRGYWSGLATFDAKMFPPPHGDGVVRGELGHTRNGDKRRYFEVAGQFSGGYSFNLRTLATVEPPVARARIYSLSFSERQPDALVRDILAAWVAFLANRPLGSEPLRVKP